MVPLCKTNDRKWIKKYSVWLQEKAGKKDHFRHGNVVFFQVIELKGLLKGDWDNPICFPLVETYGREDQLISRGKSNNKE